tara:strand:+ start:987 stop:1847 length:861 start_codon:yes stop_codon:yes gene_type:complete
MGLKSIVSRVIPIAVGYATGGPIGAAKAAASTELQKRQEKKEKQAYNEYINEQGRQRAKMAEFRDTDVIFSGTRSGTPMSTQRAGFGSSFGTFLGDVGRNILGPIGNLFSSPALTPFVSQQSIGQPALSTQGGQMGQESSTSGTRDAFVGGAGNIIGQAARFLRSPTGSAATGLAGGLVAGMAGSQPPGTRITRKMKSQFRSVLNLAGGDYQLAADMIGVSDDFFIAVMLKRFRNDGPVVTKAALRKTKSTVRRLKNMCDMYDSLRPAARRRSTPMKRASTTLIKN